MGRVKHRISNLVVTREGYNIKAEWRVPPEMVDRDNPDRATWIDIYCDFNPVKYPNQGRKGVGQSDPKPLKAAFPPGTGSGSAGRTRETR